MHTDKKIGKKINSEKCLEHNTFIEHLMRECVSFLILFLSQFLYYYFFFAHFRSTSIQNVTTEKHATHMNAYSPIFVFSLSLRLSSWKVCLVSLFLSISPFTKEKLDLWRKCRSLFFIFLIFWHRKFLHINPIT